MASEEQITISREEFEALKAENAWLKQQLAELKRLIFGAKSERFIGATNDQPTLFDVPAQQAIEQPMYGTLSARNTLLNKRTKKPKSLLHRFPAFPFQKGMPEPACSHIFW